MRTKEQLAILISNRARNQFSRDVYRLGVIIAQNHGKLSVEDMKLMLTREVCEKPSLLKRLFSKFEQEKISEEDDDNYYLMQLAFKFMDIKLTTELTLADFDSKSLGEIYYRYFKKEYEEYERHQYQLYDVELESRIREALNESAKKSIPIENEMI